MNRLSSDDAWKYWRGEIDKLGEIVKRISTDHKAVHIETQKIFDQAAQLVSPEKLDLGRRSSTSSWA
jgi:hypothetical protein